ncbi:MAG: hypothetical protein NUW01_18450 [Gemmatimonadaceae bacterium]|nr:hypothetical protein [Gemmatimonadaceae bacterium]
MSRQILDEQGNHMNDGPRTDTTTDNARMRAFLEGWMPVKADHGDRVGLSDGTVWVQCSEHEAGHAIGDCPQDLDDDDEIRVTMTFGELREALGR